MTETPWYPLQADRLTLRPYRPADLDDIQSYAGDPETTRYLPWGPNTRQATEEFLHQKLADQARYPREEYTLALDLPSAGRLIGGIRLGIRDPHNRTADLGYVLHPDYWGQGYMVEAARAILHVAFGTLKLHRVWARCDVRNTGSRRVMEKLGMRREGQALRDIWEKGEWRDSYYYAILETEWDSRA